MKKIISAVAIAAAVWLPAWADFDAGMAAYRAKDYENAFQGFEQAAIDGHETAQFNLGVLYYRGEGVDKDLARAFGWIELSTQRGDEEFIEAQEVLILLMTPEQVSEGRAQAAALADKYDLRYQPPERLRGADSVLKVSED